MCMSGHFWQAKQSLFGIQIDRVKSTIMDDMLVPQRSAHMVEKCESGLISVHSHYPYHFVLLIVCQMPMIIVYFQCSSRLSKF